jgi:NAD(P)-dependent dehydrogenase (short-subunit alcohol dehydrogenase family)
MSQTILVTGATTGFGRLTVETLARQGHTVFAGMRESAGRNRPAASDLQALAATEHWSLRVVGLDVLDDRSVAQAVEQVMAASGRLDVVVNNAGVSYAGPIEAFTTEQAQALFNTNVFGVLRLNRAALPHMRAQGSGLLVQIGSFAGRIPIPFLGLYGAAKATLEALTESYRYELAPFGIDAVIVEPGAYPTQISSNRQKPDDAERMALYAARMRTMLPRILGVASQSPDPQTVVDALAALVALPAGQRPLRTVVTSVALQHDVVTAVNDSAAQASRTFFEQLDLLPAITLAQP